MLPRLFGLLGLIAALAAAGVSCKGDPTATGSGTPVGIQTDLASINVSVGASGTVTAWVVDVRMNRLEVPVTFTACDAAVAIVVKDATFDPVPPTSAKGTVTGVTGGTTCAVVTSSGLKPDTVAVVVGKVAANISTSPSATTGPVGTTLNDTARVGGLGTLSGTITFNLYDSTKATCASGPRYTQVVTVSGAGAYHTSPGFAADKPGTWRWRAAYSGDASHTGVTSPCGEPVAIAALSPGAGTGTGAGHGPAPVVLGTAGNYVILAKSGISNVPTSAITGNLGLSPAAASAITEFPLTLDASGTFATTPQVTGNVYAADYTSPTPSNLTTAIGDMQTAYVDAAGRPTPDHTELLAGNIGGLTLPPGLYKWSNTVIIPTDVTLSGGPNDTWIFQIAQGLTEASAAKVILTGGALAQNVFWQVFGVVDIGTTATIEGEVLSQTSITLHTGANANGRLLAQTAVTLDGNTVVRK